MNFIIHSSRAHDRSTTTRSISYFAIDRYDSTCEFYVHHTLSIFIYTPSIYTILLMLVRAPLYKEKFHLFERKLWKEKKKKKKRKWRPDARFPKCIHRAEEECNRPVKISLSFSPHHSISLLEVPDTNLEFFFCLHFHSLHGQMVRNATRFF